jgi:hypothetical protein
MVDIARIPRNRFGVLDLVEAAALTPFLTGLHRLKVRRTYLELDGG